MGKTFGVGRKDMHFKTEKRSETILILKTAKTMRPDGLVV